MKSASPFSLEELLKKLPDYYTPADREQIQRAYRVAEKAHAGQKRASGEPYINHLLAVSAILAEYSMPADVVTAGLLHDTIEDTTLKAEDLKRDFSDGVVSLVQGVTKLTQLPRVSRGEHREEAIRKGDGIEAEAEVENEVEKRNRKRELATETLRKTFLAMDSDVRVVLIKLADRLHNMRTLSAFPEAKRRRIAQETLDIFAPLANRLGIWQIKWELEDLGFRYTNPDKYKEIAEQLAVRRESREAEIEHITVAIMKLLSEAGIKADISGRPKHIYSIYKKMIEKGKPFDLVRDVRGVRLIVPDVAACYAALGVIHTHWRPIPNEFDDYIAAPKDNFYQSLHTAVIYDDGKPVEVQIRTKDMDENAEFGIASHWRYKEGGPRDKYDERINWLRRVMEWRQDVDDAQEFVDSMKTDVFKDRVYVFTPHGDIIDLPAGSTPIDFAYHVHTNVGNRCRGAKVNNKLVPLDYELHTGEQVEILTAKQGGPSRDWLNPSLGLVRTQRARSKIKAWFKKQDQELNLAQGKEILLHEIQRLGLPELDDDGVRNLAIKFDRSPDELYVALGCGDINISRVVNKLMGDKESDDVLVVVPASSESAQDEAITVLGLKGLLTTMARCCNPTPGDEIIGYITRGHGATIHRQDCPNMLRIQDRERLVKVSWGENVRTYPVPIRIRAYDRQGLMGDITTLLNSENVNIVDVQVRITKNLADLRIVIEVKDISQLSRMLARIENLPNVLEAQRVKGG
ncbi:MAG TPA: bifunctional (p)ppGpp synthetase/guanosine-3',5'-bis(diphosphate) 3'-pyrophosphohydrolase [Anaerolineales bacterium]|nr:bifunctional (p)ppGpp synthetase/guanosine-3',5'-bis(diphosphate) 3'-pyrophosphohydrolase [Anaerolineales bacterium]